MSQGAKLKTNESQCQAQRRNESQCQAQRRNDSECQAQRRMSQGAKLKTNESQCHAQRRNESQYQAQKRNDDMKSTVTAYSAHADVVMNTIPQSRRPFTTEKWTQAQTGWICSAVRKRRKYTGTASSYGHAAIKGHDAIPPPPPPPPPTHTHTHRPVKPHTVRKSLVTKHKIYLCLILYYAFRETK